jgi:hypothetical protein
MVWRMRRAGRGMGRLEPGGTEALRTCTKCVVRITAATGTSEMLLERSVKTVRGPDPLDLRGGLVSSHDGMRTLRRMANKSRSLMCEAQCTTHQLPKSHYERQLARSRSRSPAATPLSFTASMTAQVIL